MVKKIRELINYLLLNPLFLSSIILCFLFYTGVINPNNKNSFISLIPISEIKELEGIVVSAPVKSLTNENYYFIDLNVTAVKSKENIYSQGKGIIKLLLKSDFVESLYPNKLNSKSKRNLLIESGLNIKLVVKSLNEDLFLVTDILDSFYEKSFKGRIFYFRALCRLNFKRLLNSWGNAGGLLLALLSGSKEYTDTSLNLSFKRAGLSHILALSGMHLSLFGSLGFFVAKRFSSKKKAYNTKMLLILLFVWFAGFTPSLLRAFIFSIIIYILTALHIKKINDISSLSLCFLIHSAIQPTHIQTPAFMLSYGALFGIITVGSFFKGKLSKIFALKIVDNFCDSFGAQICTFPILIHLFGEVAPIGVISSLIVSPLLTIFLYTGLIGIIICMIIPFLSPAFNDIIDVIYNIISNFIVYFSSFPLITLRN